MNRPLQTLTLAAALSCTMATGWASILTQTPNQQNNDYEMFMEKSGIRLLKILPLTKIWLCFRKTAHLVTLIMMIPR